MMSVTDKALEFLATLVARAHATEGSAVRIVARTGGEEGEGWGLALDQPRPEDETVEREGCTLLILGADVAETLQDSTLDVDDTPDGPRLRLR